MDDFIFRDADLVEQLAVRIESLGEEHALNTVAADLRDKAEVSRAANTTYLEAIRSQKVAEADEEIAQANLRRQYELNYLEARKTLGRAIAERLFPSFSPAEAPAEPVPAPAPAFA